MTRAEVMSLLVSGATKIGPLDVRIDMGGPGGRYRALVTAPTYNTIIGTPDTVDAEGILSFRERLASALLQHLPRAPVIECSWCGATPAAFRNRQGEHFCSRSHRASSNRARKRLELS